MSNELTLTLDQAVFASAATSRNSGYQVVAASPHVTMAERRLIHANSPSHGGLDSDEPGAVAWSYYPVSDDRVCFARSWHAGMEHSGRGGFQVHTHCLIARRDDLAPIGFHAALVLRAATEQALWKEWTPGVESLPPIELKIAAVRDGATAALPAAALGPIAACLKVLAEGQAIVLGGRGDGTSLDRIDALMSCCPARSRAELSFGVGLAFSISRLFQINIAAGVDHRVERLLRGRPVVFLHDDPKDGPAGAVPEWLDYVLTALRDGRYADAADVTELPVRLSDTVELNRAVRLLHTIARVRTAPLAEGFADAAHAGAQRGETESEQRLVADIWRAAAQRIADMAAPPNEVDIDAWRAITDIARRIPWIRPTLQPAMQRVVAAIGTGAPELATRLAVMAAQASDQAWPPLVEIVDKQCLAAMVTRAVQSREPSARAAARGLLKAWQELAPASTAARTQLARLDAPPETPAAGAPAQPAGASAASPNSTDDSLDSVIAPA